MIIPPVLPPLLPAPVLLAPVLPAPVPPDKELQGVMIKQNWWRKNTVNKNSIYAVLSRIWKCRNSRVFGANFLGPKIGRC